MENKMKKLLVGLLALGSFSAFADKCALMKKEHATKAIKILLEAESINYTNEVEINSITYRKTDYKDSDEIYLYGKSSEHYEVLVNGEVLDLGYTSVKTKIGEFIIDDLVGCYLEYKDFQKKVDAKIESEIYGEQTY
jgi:hypothetical protein